MDAKYCRFCCEYDHMKNSDAGYCCRMPVGKQVVRGDEECRCGHFIAGDFKDRVKLRRQQEEFIKMVLGNKQLNGKETNNEWI